MYRALAANDSAPALTPPLPSGWESEGCFSAGDALVDGFSFQNPSNTPMLCSTVCQNAGFVLAAVQYGTSCSCGNSLPASSVAQPATGCLTPCPSDPSQTLTCGGPFAISLFHNTELPTTTLPPLSAPTSTSSTPESSTSPSPTAPPSVSQALASSPHAALIAGAAIAAFLTLLVLLALGLFLRRRQQRLQKLKAPSTMFVARATAAGIWPPNPSGQDRERFAAMMTRSSDGERTPLTARLPLPGVRF